MSEEQVRSIDETLSKSYQEQMSHVISITENQERSSTYFKLIPLKILKLMDFIIYGVKRSVRVRFSYKYGRDKRVTEIDKHL